MFTVSEDEQLKQLVKENGLYCWERVAREMKTRTPRQCKERYVYYLDPSINKSPYTLEEDLKLLKEVEEKGKRWSSMTINFSGRTQYSLKNRWIFLNRVIKQLDKDVSFETVVKVVHELPPPKAKPRPIESKRSQPVEKNTKFSKVELIYPDPANQEEIPTEYDIDPDSYMCPQTDLDYFECEDDNFDKFFN